MDSSPAGVHIYIYLDYLTFEGNRVHAVPGHKLGRNNTNGPSGISLLRLVNYDTAPGDHNIVRNNIFWDIKQEVISSGIGQPTITDGNCVILDGTRFNNYVGDFLIENNLLLASGGAGVMVFESGNTGTSRVWIINNTSYANGLCAGQTSCGSGTAGEIHSYGSQNVRIFNNLIWGRSSLNKAIQVGASSDVVADYNHTYAVAGTDAPGANDSTGDPLVVSAGIDGAIADFHPANGTSPLVGAGTASFEGHAAPSTDLEGNPQTTPPTTGALLAP